MDLARIIIILKFNLIPDKIKGKFFQAVAMSVLLYGCTIWTLMKFLEKKLDGTTQEY